MKAFNFASLPQKIGYTSAAPKCVSGETYTRSRFSVFGSCQYLSHVRRHNMAALIIDVISCKEITYNVIK